MKRVNVVISAVDLKVPVYSTLDGSDMRKSSDLMKDLIDLQCIQPVHWPKSLDAASNPSVTHIVDFGPGGLAGSAGLTSRIKEGTGVAVILAGSSKGNSRVLSEEVLYTEVESQVKFMSNWKSEFYPKVVKGPIGELFISTKFSRLIGTSL